MKNLDFNTRKVNALRDLAWGLAKWGKAKQS